MAVELQRSPAGKDGATLVIMSYTDDLPGDVNDALFEIHLEGFGELATESAMRHVYRRDEWDGLMGDPGIVKYVAFLDGVPVAINSVARDFRAVPWLSAEYFEARYPGRTLWYVLDTIVSSSVRGSDVLLRLFSLGFEEARAGFDPMVVLSVTRQHVDRGYVELLSAVVEMHGGSPIREIDTYHYYAFDTVYDGAAEPEIDLREQPAADAAS